MIATAAAGLARFHSSGLMMRHYSTIAGLIALGIIMNLGTVGLATGVGEEQEAAPSADDPKPAAKAGVERPALPQSESFTSPRSSAYNRHIPRDWGRPGEP
jgi:hypothetical protein